jgi:predicted dehydrogenase
MPRYRIVGINFEHFHMGDLLRMAYDHPEAEIVAICDEQPERMQMAISNFGIRSEQVYTDPHACLRETRPDIVILCPAAARHGEFVELVAPYGVHVLVEKPMAATLAEADRMLAAMQPTGKLLAINWPLAWYPAHVTAKRLLDEGTIGAVVQVHFYDGNRGGSLLDYLGYGTTLGTWYHGGRAPLEVTAVVDQPAGLEVDEHSITVARYESGLSKFETRWGTFTDPWTLQPQPKCGFVIVGTDGTISSYDFEPTVRVQTRARPEGFDVPVDELQAPHRNPVEHLIHCVATGSALHGPLQPAICRIGQQIVDSAVLSAREKRTVMLVQ